MSYFFSEPFGTPRVINLHKVNISCELGPIGYDPVYERLIRKRVEDEIERCRIKQEEAKQIENIISNEEDMMIFKSVNDICNICLDNKKCYILCHGRICFECINQKLLDKCIICKKNKIYKNKLIYKKNKKNNSENRLFKMFNNMFIRCIKI